MIINDRYEYNPQSDLLGQGGFGKVYKAKDLRNNKIVALKFVEKDKFSDKYNLEGEFQKASTFDHPNLIRYFDAFDYELSNSIGQKSTLHVAAMEYANAGNLKEYNKRKLTYQQKEKIISEILSALEYLHAKNIVHRDIKPANILLNKDSNEVLTVKVSDFGISKQLKSEYSTISNVLGTTEYMSPEQLGLSTDGKIGVSADLWSFGILVYDMFLGETPFGKSSDGVSQSKILNGILNFKKAPRMSEIPEPYQKMVSRCLVLDPKKRAQNTQVLSNLIQKRNTKKVIAKTDNWKKLAIGGFVLSGILGLLLLINMFSSDNTGSVNKEFYENERIKFKVENERLNEAYGKLENEYSELKRKANSNEVVEKYTYASLDKAVLYIGVENFVTINTKGVDANNVKVAISGAGGKINKVNATSYKVVVSTAGKCTIKVKGGGVGFSKTYIAKRIPNPVAKLPNSSGGSIGTGSFKAQAGVVAVLEDFDFDAKCNISGYTIIQIPRRSDPIEVVNSGARFSAKSSNLIRRAKPGDIYLFDNIKARCPGDAASRRINSLYFKIR